MTIETKQGNLKLVGGYFRNKSVGIKLIYTDVYGNEHILRNMTIVTNRCRLISTRAFRSKCHRLGLNYKTVIKQAQNLLKVHLEKIWKREVIQYNGSLFSSPSTHGTGILKLTNKSGTWILETTSELTESRYQVGRKIVKIKERTGRGYIVEILRAK